MTKRIAPVPRGYRTATPQLIVQGADAALAYYADVFGAQVLSRVTGEDGVTVLQAEIKIGNSIIRVMDEMPLFGIYSPLAYGGAPSSIHLYMPTADEFWDQAVANGVGILVPMADQPWGERFGKFVDAFGHVWSVSKRIKKKAETAAADAPAVDAPETAEAVDTAAGPFSVHEPLANATGLSAEQEMVANSTAA